MYADDSHNSKPGFFSKIFGHDDPAPVADPAATPVEAEVTPAPVVDSAAAPDPVQPMFADVELQPGTMSDVHATPGTTETLDLSASNVTQPEAAADTSETFELPDIKTANDTANPTVDVVLPDALAEESKDEVVFDSTAPQPAEGDAVEPATTPEPVEAAAPTQPVDETPPAPPVAEGEAWTASQASAEPAAAEAPAEESTGSSQAGLSDAQNDISSILSTHKDMTVPEPESAALSPASVATSAPDVVPTIASPLEAGGKASIEDNSMEPSEPENGSQRAAAVARLQGHIDELETSLQKVRDELGALK